MNRYDCGIEVDDEAGGNASGLVEFVQLCALGKPNGTYISIDVAGTPGGVQRTCLEQAIDSLDWVNLMVSAPAYDQTNSVNFAHVLAKVPYNKITVAYYAGTWVDNCNTIGSGPGTLGAGLQLFHKFRLKGLSIWAVMKGGSYNGCGNTSAAGFAATLDALRKPPPPTPPTPPTPAPAPEVCKSISPPTTDAWCQKNCIASPPYCPPSICKCSGGGPDAPTAAPPPPGPGPPGPAPSPSPGPAPAPGCKQRFQICSSALCCAGLTCKGNQCQ
jgi:hypothetical protein